MSVITGNFGGREVAEVDRTDATKALEDFIAYLDGDDAEIVVVAYLPEMGYVSVNSNMLSSDSTMTVLEMGKFSMLTAILEGEGSHNFMGLMQPTEVEDDDAE